MYFIGKIFLQYIPVVTFYMTSEFTWEVISSVFGMLETAVSRVLIQSDFPGAPNVQFELLPPADIKNHSI